MKAIYKRKKKLINKPMQLKMVAVFTAIGCTCALFQVVLVNFGLLGLAKSIPGGGTEVLSKARGMMAQNVLWTLAAMIPLMTCVGVILTHRIAGPAYRMTQHCKAIAAGEPVRPCKIRKDDELHDLCDALNAAIAHLAPSEDASEAQVQGETEPWALEDAPSLVQSERTPSATVVAQEVAKKEASA